MEEQEVQSSPRSGLPRRDEMKTPDVVSSMVRLKGLGWGAKRIARTLGIARNTVRRYLNAGGPVPYRQPQRDSVLGGHEAWLRERFLQQWLVLTA